MVCEQCGHGNQPGRKFCAECGSALLQACPGCGSPNEPTDKFCGECGTALTPSGPHATSEPIGSTSVEPALERRLVTVLFADLVGFTPFSESRDPEEVRGFLTRYFDAATEVIERFGGVVEKFIGDAVMAVWGAVAASEDDAERAVRAGLELAETVGKLGADAGVAELTVRVGVLTGEASVGPGGNDRGLVIGDMVNTASRLQSVAPPGGVAVGESTYRLTEHAIAFEPLGEQDLKGKSLPVPAWRARHVVGMRGGDRRAEGLEAPFVGRNEELRLLKDQLHATGGEGRSRLVSVTGIAGIGKSRLVWEFLKYVDGLVEPVYWHEGRSPAYGEGIAFWALAEMVRGRARIAETDDHDLAAAKLREMLETYIPVEEERGWLAPRLSGLLGIHEMPSSERGELFSAFRRLFERISERGTTVLVFEDLHWADAGLLDFVDELTEWSRDNPILVVTVARPELLDRRPTWGGGRRNFMSVAVGPLADDAMHALVTGLVPGIPGEAAEIVEERAAGIPLYAVELVRMLLLEDRLGADDDGVYHLVGDPSDLAVPDSLHAVIGARLDRLEPDDRALLQDAAMLGQSFTGEILAALTGRDLNELSEHLTGLVRKELLTFDVDPRSPERGQYAFIQSLIREVTYSRLSRQDRRDRHLEIAQHFEQIGDVELLPIVADHYLNAMRAAPDEADASALEDRTLTALREAADRSASLHSYEQVLAYCAQALELTAGTGREPEWWERAAEASHALVRSDDAERYAQLLVEHRRSEGDKSGLLRAYHMLGLVYAEGRDPHRAVQVLEPAVAELGDIDADPDGAALVALLARSHMLIGNFEASAAAAERALIAAELQDLLDVLTDALITRGTVLGDLRRPREGAILLRGALDLARSEDLVLAELRAGANLAYVLWADDFTEALDIQFSALDRARTVGSRTHLLFAAGTLAGGLMDVGRWEEALAIIDEFQDRDLPPSMWASFETGRAWIVALRANPDEAQKRLETIAPIRETETDPQVQRQWKVDQAWIALAAGEIDRAQELAMDAIDLDPFGYPGTYVIATYTALASIDAARLIAVRDAIDVLPRRERLVRASRRSLDAALSVLAGEPESATTAFEEARELWSTDRPIDRGVFLLLFARLADGRHPAAEEAGREGREILERLGADALLGLDRGRDAAV